MNQEETIVNIDDEETILTKKEKRRLARNEYNKSDKRKATRKAWDAANRERINATQREWRKTPAGKASKEKYNKSEKGKLVQKKQNQTPNTKLSKKNYAKSAAGRKSKSISCWKRSGLISDDWEATYERYITSICCEFCSNAFTTHRGSNRHLDHDHSITDSCNIRGVICFRCNITDVMGKIYEN